MRSFFVVLFIVSVAHMLIENSQVYNVYLFYLFLLMRERERERDQFVVPPIYALIG